jgi:CRP-like cAMP-binding protein
MPNLETERRASADPTKSRVHRAIKLAPIFDKAGRATRDAVAEAAALEVVPAGMILVAQGAAADSLGVLARGRARIERASGTRAIPLGYRGAGDAVGEACLGAGATHTETATAMEEAEIVRIPLLVMRELLASDAALAPAVIELLLARQREIEDRVESLLFLNVEGRVAEFLSKAAQRWGVPVPKGTLISAPLTHLEIAEAIGSTRETVTVTLGALRKDGLLDVHGRRLIVVDKDALAARHDSK